MSDLYRKTSLDRLSSPEQLDKMIKITPPMFWIGAAGEAFIFIMVLLEALNKDRTASAEDMDNNVRKAVAEFVGEAPGFDDITSVVLKYFGKNKVPVSF